MQTSFISLITILVTIQYIHYLTNCPSIKRQFVCLFSFHLAYRAGNLTPVQWSGKIINIGIVKCYLTTNGEINFSQFFFRSFRSKLYVHSVATDSPPPTTAHHTHTRKKKQQQPVMREFSNEVSTPVHRQDGFSIQVEFQGSSAYTYLINTDLFYGYVRLVVDGHPCVTIIYCAISCPGSIVFHKRVMLWWTSLEKITHNYY